MSVITANQFNNFLSSYPEMQHFYPQLNSADDREFMYEEFFAPADELDDPLFDENDFEYQQSLYA
jgi:hypothetical protein